MRKWKGVPGRIKEPDHHGLEVQDEGRVYAGDAARRWHSRSCVGRNGSLCGVPWLSVSLRRVTLSDRKMVMDRDSFRTVGRCCSLRGALWTGSCRRAAATDFLRCLPRQGLPPPRPGTALLMPEAERRPGPAARCQHQNSPLPEAAACSWVNHPSRVHCLNRIHPRVSGIPVPPGLVSLCASFPSALLDTVPDSRPHRRLLCPPWLRTRATNCFRRHGGLRQAAV